MRWSEPAVRGRFATLAVAGGLLAVALGAGACVRAGDARPQDAALRPNAEMLENRTPSVPLRVEGDVVAFAFEPVGARPLSSAELAGRFSVLALVSSYDAAALAQARFLVELAHRHTPRINVGLLFFEPRENLPLMELFLQRLDFPGPAGLADADTLAGRGVFPGLHHVPAVLVLDPRGRELRRALGLTEPQALEELLRAVER